MGEKIKNRFIAVDVWRPTFGDPSVKAINELFKRDSGLSDAECRETTLRNKVDFLRKLEKPDYKPIHL